MKKTLTYMLLLVSLLTTILPTVTAYAKVDENLLGYNILAEPENRNDLIKVEEYKVISGDTADFKLDREDDSLIKAKFILIETPKLKEDQEYAQEAKERVEELFEEADLIQVEYDEKEKEKEINEADYDLVHVWVDGILLQEILVSEGYAIAQNTEDYNEENDYLETIFISQDYALRNSLNIWYDGDDSFIAKAEYPEVNELVQVSTYSEPSNDTNELSSNSNSTSQSSSYETGSTSGESYTSTDTYEEWEEWEDWEEEAVEQYVEEPPIQEYVYYQNCTAARAAGVTPIYYGEPGYASHLDRDGDGIACE